MTTMKVITEPRLVELLKGLQAEYQVYVPVELADGTRVMGTLDEGPAALLGGQVAAKPTAFFFPQMDTLFHFERGAVRDEAPAGKPVCVVGLSAADAEGLAFMQQFFQEQKRKGIIRTDIDDQDLTLLCSTLAQGLTSSVNSGLDPAEAKRLWLLGFARLADVRPGKNQE